jgi:hypothetical protein
MSDQRGEPVSLEEMTRRRDGWRAKAEAALGVIRVHKARVTALTDQLIAAEAMADRSVAEARRQDIRAVAAEADARRYAQECGRLRDRLDLKDEEIMRLIGLAADR